MKRKGCLLLLLVLSGPGCLSPGSRVAVESRQSQPVRMAVAPPSAPTPQPIIVTADQVNENNAAQAAQALSSEMDYETNNRRMPTTMATTMANPMRP